MNPIPRLILVALAVVASATTVGAGDAFVTLAPGESAFVPAGEVTLGFVGVPVADGYLMDSRCPTQVLCVWEGDAAMDFWVEDGNSERVDFRLHTSPLEGDQTFQYDTVQIILLRLSPEPEVPGGIAPEDYRVELLAVPAARVPLVDDSWGTLKGNYRD